MRGMGQSPMILGSSMNILKELEEYVTTASTAPTLAGMPRLDLAAKGIAGATGAHFIEEVHTPFNLGYITVTTGSTAFQNIVGVTPHEIADRVTASARALRLCGVKPGDRILCTYAPLVNVFPRRALDEYGVTWSFLRASSRDALILALCAERPRIVMGESSFLRAALEDAAKMGLTEKLPRGVVFIAAGTPLDPELAPTLRRLADGSVHDLYGCQEFGWLTLDGTPLRDDITLVDSGDGEYFDLVVGGLPTGDRFPVLDAGHACNTDGKIITYSRVRSAELVTTITASTASSRDTAERLARTVLRIKARIVRVSPDVKLGAAHTAVSVAPYGEPGGTHIEGPALTNMLDSLLCAQLDYQSGRKSDPAWIKGR